MQDQNNTPPEYFFKENQEKNNNRADIWTLGSILYKLYFGSNLIDSKNASND